MMKKNGGFKPKPNRFSENIEKWRNIDREKWEKKHAEAARKAPPPRRRKMQKPVPKKIQNFDDTLIPTVAKSPAQPDDIPQESITEDFEDEINDDVKAEATEDLADDWVEEQAVISESTVVQAKRQKASKPARRKYPACSHHVSSIFPYDRRGSKKTISSQRTKLVQQQLKSTEDTRRLRKEHEAEVHKLKKKIERMQSHLMKLKIENKSYSNQVDSMSEKIRVFEAKEGATMSEERKNFIHWKKTETKKLKKLQRELDSKAKLILNAPSKQLRRDIQELNEQHGKKISEMKDKHDRIKAHNDSLRRKVLHLETELKTLKVTNERLTQANAEALSNHAAKVLRPALAVIAKQNEKKQKEAVFLKSTTKRKLVQNPTVVVKPNLNNSPLKRRRLMPEIKPEYHPDHLTTEQQNSFALHENQAPYESVERTHYICHKYGDGTEVRIFNSGAVIRKFPDGVDLIQHDNGDKEKRLKEGEGEVKCYWFTQQRILKIIFASGEQWIRFDNGEFQQVDPSGKKTIFRKDGKLISQS